MARQEPARTPSPSPSSADKLALVTVVGRPAVPKQAPKQAPERPTEPNTPTAASARECGPCRVCCRLPDIPELSKPIDTWCVHVDLEPGAPPCTIYSRRPAVCRAFDCAWKQGLGSDLDRPDILGVMWQTVTMPDGEPGLGVVEAKPGALDAPRVRRLLRQFERRKPGRVVVRRAHEPSFAAVSVLIEGKPLGSSAPSRHD